MLFLASCAEGEELGARPAPRPSGSGGSPVPVGAAGQVPTDGTSGRGGNVGSGGSTGTDASSGGSSGAGRDAGMTTTDARMSTDSGATGQTIFFDDFETGSASRWMTNSPADWSVVDIDGGAHVYQQSAVSNTFRVAAAGSVLWADQTVEARVNILSFGGGSTSYLVAVYARFKDVDNHYYLAVESNTKLTIRANSGGTNMKLTSAVDTGMTTNAWHTVKLQAKGSTLSAYVDGVEKVTVSDTAIASGGIALGCINSSAQFDDVKVTIP
jgi:Concanavalin A-like lectin/glucanases superfamily